MVKAMDFESDGISACRLIPGMGDFFFLFLFFFMMMMVERCAAAQASLKRKRRNERSQCRR